jgi:hypothetical protein
MERHSNDASAGRVDALDGVHQLAHQVQASALLTIDLIGRRGIDARCLDIEAGSLVLDLDDEPFMSHFRANVNVLRGVVAIAAENGVGNSFRECDWYVQPDLAGGEPHDLTLASHELHDSLDEADVARNLDLDDADGVSAGRIVFV